MKKKVQQPGPPKKYTASDSARLVNTVDSYMKNVEKFKNAPEKSIPGSNQKVKMGLPSGFTETMKNQESEINSNPFTPTYIERLQKSKSQGGGTKSMNYNAMPVKNEQAKTIMDSENKNLKIGNAKKTEKYIK